MTRKPVVFDDYLVRALIDGRKTELRRPLSFGTQELAYDRRWNAWRSDKRWQFHFEDGTRSPFFARCFAVPGDQFFVREAFRVRDVASDVFTVIYRATKTRSFTEASQQFPTNTLGTLKLSQAAWRQANHMPPQASRLTLLVLDARLQRLQDMTEADAQAEGYACLADFRDRFYSQYSPSLWGPNPWFTVAEFSVVQANILTQELAA